MQVNCDICGQRIKDPYYIDVSATLIKHDEAFVGSLKFSVKEKEDFVQNLVSCKDCWHELVLAKKYGKRVKFK